MLTIFPATPVMQFSSSRPLDNWVMRGVDPSGYISRFLRNVLVRFICHSLFTQSQSSCPQSCQLGLYLVLFVGNLVGLALFRPEVGDAESFFEVGSEVVHVTDGEEDVEPELNGL